MLKTGVLQMFCRSVFHICIPLVELGLATPVFANVGVAVILCWLSKIGVWLACPFLIQFGLQILAGFRNLCLGLRDGHICFTWC